MPRLVYIFFRLVVVVSSNINSCRPIHPPSIKQHRAYYLVCMDVTIDSKEEQNHPETNRTTTTRKDVHTHTHTYTKVRGGWVMLSSWQPWDANHPQAPISSILTTFCFNCDFVETVDWNGRKEPTHSHTKLVDIFESVELVCVCVCVRLWNTLRPAPTTTTTLLLHSSRFIFDGL